MESETNFSIYLMTTIASLNYPILREVLGYSCLDTQTCYVCAHQEQSQIILLLENISLDFSLGKNLNVYAVCIPSNLGDIFSMIAQDLTAIRIQEETLLATLLCF